MHGPAKWFFCLMLASAALSCAPSFAQHEAAITVSNEEISRTNLVLGYTFTECTYRASREQCGRSAVDPQAAESAQRAEADLGKHIANVQIYGWGSPNPMPAPGQYNLQPLYKRLEIARTGGATLMVTFCCSPDWMVGEAPGSSYSGRNSDFPRREHWATYADLAKRIAKENPDVKFFQVWNEFKGLYIADGSSGHWDAKAYTEFYNLLYSSIKQVRPDANVGGPYIVFGAWTDGHAPVPSGLKVAGLEFDVRALDAMRYWLKNKVGAEFIAVDGSNEARDVKRKVAKHSTSPFERCSVFSSAVRWIRNLGEQGFPGSTTLPVIWSEWYAHADTAEERLPVIATCLIETARSGAAGALIWGPEGLGDTDQSFPLSLWTGTSAGGGRPTNLHKLLKEFAQRFPPNTRLYRVTGRGPVTALASPSSVFVVNQSPGTLSLELNGTQLRLQKGAAVFIDRRNVQSGNR